MTNPPEDERASRDDAVLAGLLARAEEEVVPTHPNYDPDEGLQRFLEQLGNGPAAEHPHPFREVSASHGRSPADAMGVIDIAAVDDHTIILDCIAGWLMTSESDIRVVDTATTVDALLAGPGRHADIVLLDAGDGTTVESNVGAIVAAGPAVLVLPASDRPPVALAAMRAGARYSSTPQACR